MGDDHKAPQRVIGKEQTDMMYYTKTQQWVTTYSIVFGMNEHNISEKFLGID